MKFVKAETAEPAIDHLVNSISLQLRMGQDVLWLLSGGSSIPFQVEAAKRLAGERTKGITAVLTDERYDDDINHPESNWRKLQNAGFKLPGAHLEPVLKPGLSFEETARQFDRFILEQLGLTAYKIVVAGVGQDGHTLGVLGNSPALEAKGATTFYHGSDNFDRITMTLGALKAVDEGISLMLGELKHPIIDQLMTEDLDWTVQPAQALKTVKNMTVYNDYKGEPA